MSRITIFSTGICPLCEKTKQLLHKWGLDYDECRVDLDQGCLKRMLQTCQNARTVPQIIIDDKWIGSFTELTELHMDGELDELLGN